jgi:SAM-dependent methyltransferase
MRLDIQDLSDFYRSPLGTVARRLLARRIRMLWPDTRQQNVLGIGYAAPFMRPFLAEAQRVILAMPGEQGAIRWPRQGPSCTFLTNDIQLPLADASVDKLLAVHCLEVCGDANALLREIWRVLAPEGQLLLITPNRRGLWARFDTTPFGQGHPYSRAQLERLLSECLYQPAQWLSGLFMPPLNWRIVLKTAVAVERVGLYGWPGFAGVLMVGAQKRLYAPVGSPVTEKAKLRVVKAARPTALSTSPHRQAANGTERHAQP